MVARYPIDDWIDRKHDYFSARRWCRVAMEIAKKDYENLCKVFLAAEQEMKRLPEDFPEGEIVGDGGEVFAQIGEGVKGKAFDCQCGQGVCLCGERQPRKMPRASSSSSMTSSGTSSSSCAMPAATAWTVVEEGRLAPGGRRSECSADSLEQAQRAAVMAASSIELGLVPDAIYEC